MFPKINLKFLTLTVLLVNSTIAKKAKVYTNCLKPGQFVLTFDDGPNPSTTPKALEVLEKYNIKGTFFINSQNWSDLDNDPSAVEIVKKIYKAGHTIGSHTYHHKDLFEAIDDGTMKENIDAMTDKIEDIIGVRPAYFRPPCGNGGYVESDSKKKKMTEEIQKYLGERGYSIIMWGTDTRDWEHKEKTEKVIETLNEELASPGVSPKTNSYIALFHDVYDTTVSLNLPNVIEYVQGLGYTFVSLPECIGVPPYQNMDDDLEDNSSSSNNSSNNKQSSDQDTKQTSDNNNDDNKSSSTFPSYKNDKSTPVDVIKNDSKKTGNDTSDAVTLHYSIFLSIIAVILSALL